MTPHLSQTVDAGVEFDPVLIPLAGIASGLIWLIAVRRLDALWGTWRFIGKIITGFPPLFTVFVSPLITYFCICGSLSSLTATLLEWCNGDKSVSAGLFLGCMKAVEWACSFICPLVYSVFLVRLGLSFQCCLVLTLSHALVAGYRTAKYIVSHSDDGLIVYITSGPKIMEQFDPLDGLVPLTAFLALSLWQHCAKINRLPGPGMQGRAGAPKAETRHLIQ